MIRKRINVNKEVALWWLRRLENCISWDRMGSNGTVLLKAETCFITIVVDGIDQEHCEVSLPLSHQDKKRQRIFGKLIKAMNKELVGDTKRVDKK